MKLDEMPEEYLLYGYLFSLTNRIQTLGDGVFGEVTMKQHFLLICLSVFEKPPSLQETAKFMGCTYQNVKRMASALEKSGYLKLVRDEKDHRRLNLLLTGKAYQFEEKYRGTKEEFMKKLYDGISPEETDATLRTILKMDENLKR